MAFPHQPEMDSGTVANAWSSHQDQLAQIGIHFLLHEAFVGKMPACSSESKANHSKAAFALQPAILAFPEQLGYSRVWEEPP
jgi:hypothetical protein